jgi:hypothetical protein
MTLLEFSTVAQRNVTPFTDHYGARAFRSGTNRSAMATWLAVLRKATAFRVVLAATR